MRFLKQMFVVWGLFLIIVCCNSNVVCLCACVHAHVSPLYRQAWDLAVDICLSQLPTIIEEGTAFRVSVCVYERKTNTFSASSERWNDAPFNSVFVTKRACVYRLVVTGHLALMDGSYLRSVHHCRL